MLAILRLECSPWAERLGHQAVERNTEGGCDFPTSSWLVPNHTRPLSTDRAPNAPTVITVRSCRRKGSGAHCLRVSKTSSTYLLLTLARATMADVQHAPLPEASQPQPIPGAVQMPARSSATVAPSSASRLRNSYLNPDVFSPVNQNGSYECDRVLKSGFVQKRTRKTKVKMPWSI